MIIFEKGKENSLREHTENYWQKSLKYLKQVKEVSKES